MTKYEWSMAQPRSKPKDVPLSPLDLQVEAFVHSFVLREGTSPSQREIARSVNRRLYSVQISLKKLIAHGRMEASLKNGKGLLPTKSMNTASSVPLLGTVAAGRPIEAIEGREQIEVPSWMMKRGANYFVLRVQGQSMIDDHIENGDLVLIRQSQSAHNGDRVVALIDNEATLKRFKKKNGRVVLYPANSSMPPIQVETDQEFRIAGIFAGVLRKVPG
jgi:repressor LexA